MHVSPPRHHTLQYHFAICKHLPHDDDYLVRLRFHTALPLAFSQENIGASILIMITADTTALYLLSLYRFSSPMIDALAANTAACYTR